MTIVEARRCMAFPSDVPGGETTMLVSALQRVNLL
jgi:hypothetical protein